MTAPDSVIAWLVPTARDSPADKATRMPENAFHAIPTASAPYLSARLPNLAAAAPKKALQLAFDRPARRPGRFVLGADPRCCDLVLPPLPGIAPQHCALRFDAHARLVLDDFSGAGSQVWYGWESCGDRADHSWVLSPAPGAAEPQLHQMQRVVIDIQGVRFQVLPGDAASDPDAYVARVDAFCEQPGWAGALTAGWDRASVAPVAPLFSAAPLFRHIFVTGLAEGDVGDVYLWNTSKPWEPMVRAAAA